MLELASFKSFSIELRVFFNITRRLTTFDTTDVKSNWIASRVEILSVLGWLNSVLSRTHILMPVSLLFEVFKNLADAIGSQARLFTIQESNYSVGILR